MSRNLYYGCIKTGSEKKFGAGACGDIFCLGHFSPGYAGTEQGAPVNANIVTR